MNSPRVMPIIALLLVGSVLQLPGGSKSSETFEIEETDVRKRWAQDGRNYVLADGDIFRETRRGDYEFIIGYYDPAFYKKNYVVHGSELYLRIPEDGGRMIRTRNEYSDDFESYEGFTDIMLKREMIEETGTWDYGTFPTRWGSLTLQSPSAPDVARYVDLRRRIVHEGADFIDNRVDLSEEQAHSGMNSLKFYSVAPGRSMVTAKSSISTESVAFKKGDDFWFSGWFYLEKGMPTTIMDLESTWLEGHSGIRILFSPEGTPYIELKAFDKPALRNMNYRMPRNRWVEVRAHFVLDDVSGLAELWIDNEKVIEGMMPTLPLEDTILDSVEIGISATGEETILFVDDVRISGKVW